MEAALSLRIVRTRYKLLYFLGWGALILLLAIRVYPAVPWPLKEVIGNAAFVLFVVVAVRSFRGAREPIDPPRAGWRMTATVRSGFVMASLVLVIAILGALGSTIWARVAPTPERYVDLGLGTAEYLVLCALYVDSAVRLRRSPDPAAGPPVTFAPPLTGLD